MVDSELNRLMNLLTHPPDRFGQVHWAALKSLPTAAWEEPE